MFYIQILDGGAGPWSYNLDVTVEGLPDGIPFKKPSCYGVKKLRAILDNEGQLTIKGKAHEHGCVAMGRKGNKVFSGHNQGPQRICMKFSNNTFCFGVRDLLRYFFYLS